MSKRRPRAWSPHGRKIRRSLALNRLRDQPSAPAFETKSQARARARADATKLGQRLPEVRTIIKECRPASPCDTAACAFCGRALRRWFFPEVVGQVTPGNASIVTTILERVAAASLSNVDLGAIHRRLRSRIRRAGFVFAVGGIEVEYRADVDAFDLHAHLVVEPANDATIDALRKSSASAGPRAVKRQPLRDPTRQLSYLLKFMTVHRPGGSKTRAVPLPRAAHRALMEWRAKYPSRRFVFLFGARIVRGHIRRRS